MTSGYEWDLASNPRQNGRGMRVIRKRECPHCHHVTLNETSSGTNVKCWTCKKFINAGHFCDNVKDCGWAMCYQDDKGLERRREEEKAADAAKFSAERQAHYAALRAADAVVEKKHEASNEAYWDSMAKEIELRLARNAEAARAAVAVVGT
jgi:ribosomal protein S27E